MLNVLSLEWRAFVRGSRPRAPRDVREASSERYQREAARPFFAHLFLCRFSECPRQCTIEQGPNGGRSATGGCLARQVVSHTASSALLTLLALHSKQPFHVTLPIHKTSSFRQGADHLYVVACPSLMANQAQRQPQLLPDLFLPLTMLMETMQPKEPDSKDSHPALLTLGKGTRQRDRRETQQGLVLATSETLLSLVAKSLGGVYGTNGRLATLGKVLISLWAEPFEIFARDKRGLAPYRNNRDDFAEVLALLCSRVKEIMEKDCPPSDKLRQTAIATLVRFLLARDC